MITIKSAAVRKAVKILVPLLFIPGVIALGVFVFREKQYALISLAVAVLALALFIAGFERKKTGTRRLIIVAVMVALSVAGRFIPFFKPVTALTIITAMYLGGDAVCAGIKLLLRAGAVDALPDVRVGVNRACRRDIIITAEKKPRVFAYLWFYFRHGLFAYHGCMDGAVVQRRV